MPYIDVNERKKIDQGGQPQNAGELNYAVSRLIDQYLIRKGKIRYQNLNEVIGVLECAKLELYRRIAAPYEELKLNEQGDVYSHYE
ncbi:MAG: hypothetical protein ACE5EH_08155 [Gammaproteobacteria bacterium]